ncbi:MAG: ATP synthase subunit I [Verrucomicrobia bacterium]|nr:ATP synthase subunit I [Verrucomicrobiota bacterium]
MNTAEIITLSLAVLAGFLIGAIFFGGLWWTVLYGLKVKRPALLFILSLTARFGLALTGFYVVGGGQAERLVACLVGFIVSRALVGTLQSRKRRGAPHEPGRRRQDDDSLPDEALRSTVGSCMAERSRENKAPVDHGGSPCI